LPNNPAHWKAEREKGDLIAKVEDKYGHLLQEAQQEILDIKNHIREAQKTEKTRIETILHSDEFVTYMDLLTSGDETNSKRLKKILSSTWGLNDAQINELLNK
jgi:hypothetical protein